MPRPPELYGPAATPRVDLDALADAYDRAVAADSAVDPFCTRSMWLRSYHDAFDPARPLFVERAGDDWVWLAQQQHPAIGPYLEPLENAWGFACPLVGENSGALLARMLAARRLPVLLLGLPLDESRLRQLLDGLEGTWGARRLEPTTRYVASLAGGFDVWLSRRSSAFRRNIRAAQRRVEAAGVAFERAVPGPHEAAALYRRVLEVEARSWKGRTGRGADVDPMRTFYAVLWRLLAPRAQLRLLFAVRGDETVGYLHGALVDGHFRGLQFSHDDALRPLGLGNLLQLEMLRWLCDEGATRYDLGSRQGYKNRWAEPGLTTSGLFLRPTN